MNQSLLGRLKLRGGGDYIAVYLGQLIIQGYPQRMRLQRRLYGIYTFCFLIFTIPCNYKLVSLFAVYIVDTI